MAGTFILGISGIEELAVGNDKVMMLLGSSLLMTVTEIGFVEKEGEKTPRDRRAKAWRDENGDSYGVHPKEPVGRPTEQVLLG